MERDVIKQGDYVIVQRQRYTKLCKIQENKAVWLGTFMVELDNAVGEKYQTTFQMKPKRGAKKTYVLEKVDQTTSISQLSIETSGVDNRNITDDGSSQALTKDEISRLKDEALGSCDIVGQLINNSRTFSSKTEYAQEKYMKKKEKKYFEYVQLRKPTVRLLVQMFYRQDPTKTLGVRIDDLSQILTYANVQADGNYLLYDSGSPGLITAAVLNAIGAGTTGKLIHAHPGNECRKTAVLALGFPQEQLDRCINVNVYSVLRCFYQNKTSYQPDGGPKRKLSDDGDEEQEQEPPAKSSYQPVEERTRKLSDDGDEEQEQEPPAKNSHQPVGGRKRKLSDDGDEEREREREREPPGKKPCWQEDNERACRVLQDKVDGLIVVCKEHPVSIIKELLEFLDGSRSLVVFNLLKEPLQDLYLYLKGRTDIVSLRLSGNFMRNYQILPDRTHPEVNMSNGGYILTGFKLEC